MYLKLNFMNMEIFYDFNDDECFSNLNSVFINIILQYYVKN